MIREGGHMRCRVATWNIHACVGTDGRLDPARTAEVLAGLDADVIGLQEVDWRKPPVDGLDQLSFLARRLDMQLVEGPNLHDHRGRYGNGLLASRAPESATRVDLSVAGREPRGAIDAVFRDGKFALRVLVTHLGLTRAERSTQTHRLRRTIEEDCGCDAVVLLGDVNEWRRARRAIRLVPEPFPAIARMATFPSRFPVLPLDAILARPVPKSFHSRVVDTSLARRASDHLPVVADLEWA